MGKGVTEVRRLTGWLDLFRFPHIVSKVMHLIRILVLKYEVYQSLEVLCNVFTPVCSYPDGFKRLRVLDHNDLGDKSGISFFHPSMQVNLTYVKSCYEWHTDVQEFCFINVSLVKWF